MKDYASDGIADRDALIRLLIKALCSIEDMQCSDYTGEDRREFCKRQRQLAYGVMMTFDDGRPYNDPPYERTT